MTVEGRTEIAAWIDTLDAVDDSVDWVADVRSRCTHPGMFSLPDGWVALVASLAADLARIAPGYRVTQVKEKFAGLRFYADAHIADTEPAADLRRALFDTRINVAEAASFTVCELCGAPGAVRPTRWMRTLCGRCSADGFALHNGTVVRHDTVAARLDVIFADTQLGSSAQAAEQRRADSSTRWLERHADTDRVHPDAVAFHTQDRDRSDRRVEILSEPWQD